MTKHKWHKEIKAWADGAEIEVRSPLNNGWSAWVLVENKSPQWFNENQYRIKPQPKEAHDINVDWKSWESASVEFRIKPQEQQSCCCRQTCSDPKEPQYLYVYQSYEETTFGDITIKSEKRSPINGSFIGKIKLENDE